LKVRLPCLMAKGIPFPWTRINRLLPCVDAARRPTSHFATGHTRVALSIRSVARRHKLAEIPIVRRIDTADVTSDPANRQVFPTASIKAWREKPLAISCPSRLPSDDYPAAELRANLQMRRRAPVLSRSWSLAEMSGPDTKRAQTPFGALIWAIESTHSSTSLFQAAAAVGEREVPR